MHPIYLFTIVPTPGISNDPHSINCGAKLALATCPGFRLDLIDQSAASLTLDNPVDNYVAVLSHVASWRRQQNKPLLGKSNQIILIPDHANLNAI